MAIEKLTLEVTEEQKLSILTFINFNNWNDKVVDEINDSNTRSDPTIPIERHEDGAYECEHCYCSPCVTSKQLRQLWWPDTCTPPRHSNAPERKEIYQNCAILCVMMMNKIQPIARKMFTKYLLVTNTCTASSLLGLGDCIIQQIERLDNPNKTYNFQRTGRMFTMGFLFGPVTHVWYKILDRYLPGAGLRTVASKILADQTVAGPFFCSAFFMGMSLLEGKSSREGMEEVKSKFWTVYMLDWCLWPPAQFINFFFLPPSFRVVYVSGVTLVWNTILSWMKHKEHHVETEVE